MGTLKVLDTNIVIYLLEGRLREPLGTARACVSVVSEMELLSHARLDAVGVQTIRRLLAAIPVIELTRQVKEAAIELRRQHRLTIPDAIIAATAVTLDAELLTNDAKLAAVPGLQCRALALKQL